MTELAAEARLFATALTGEPPSDYVMAQYARAHQHLALRPSTPTDHLLLDYAAQGPLAVRAADGYARIFAPTSALRRKLSVMVAILESTSPSDAHFAPIVEPWPTTIVRLKLAGAGFFWLLVVALVTLAPLDVAARFGAERP